MSHQHKGGGANFCKSFSVNTLNLGRYGNILADLPDIGTQNGSDGAILVSGIRHSCHGAGSPFPLVRRLRGARRGSQAMPPKKCPLCGNIVCRHHQVTEAGTRMSDIVNNVRLAHDWSDISRSWMAFSLQDGHSDGNIYDTRDECVRFHRNRAQKYFYFSFRNAMHGISPREATVVLALTRVQADRGRYHPEAPQDVINPVTMADVTQEMAEWLTP